MKYLRLYDLKNEKVTIIQYPKHPLSNPNKKGGRTKKRKMNRCVIRFVKQAAFAAAEITVSLALGLVFLHFVSEKLREIRGYDAVGSEYFAAAFIAIFVFLILERVREWLWTRK